MINANAIFSFYWYGMFSAESQIVMASVSDTSISSI